MVRSLADHPNIKGIKDSAGSWEILDGFLQASKPFADFDVLTGPDSLIYRGFAAGSIGCISGIANIIPEKVNAVYRNVLDNHHDQAQDVQNIINQIRTELYGIAFSPAVVKKTVNMLGHRVGDSRYPVAFTPEDVARIDRVIDSFSLR